MEPPGGMTDWGHAVVVDPKELEQLRRENHTHGRRSRRLQKRMLVTLSCTSEPLECSPFGWLESASPS
jgi:hypothetical protein